MTYEELAEWLSVLVDQGQLDRDQAEDVLQQRALFDTHREEIKAEYEGHVVGYTAGYRLVENQVSSLVDLSLEKDPGRLMYFEPIGHDPFR